MLINDLNYTEALRDFFVKECRKYSQLNEDQNLSEKDRIIWEYLLDKAEENDIEMMAITDRMEEA